MVFSGTLKYFCLKTASNRIRALDFVNGIKIGDTPDIERNFIAQWKLLDL